MLNLIYHNIHPRLLSHLSSPLLFGTLTHQLPNSTVKGEKIYDLQSRVKLDDGERVPRRGGEDKEKEASVGLRRVEEKKVGRNK